MKRARLIPARYAAGLSLAWVILAHATPVGAASPDPGAFVRKHVARFAKLVAARDDGSLDRLRLAVREVFDFESFSERALGERCQKLAPEQKRRYRAAIQGILENGYLKHPDKIFAKHRVQVGKQVRNGERAEVHGTVKQEDVDIEVVVKLHLRGNRWWAYDVVFDEMSLLEDYQYQFRSYVQKNSFAALLEQLENKAGVGRKGAGKGG